MASASSPLMSMSDLQTAQASPVPQAGSSDGFDDVAAREVFLWREEEVDHKLDHLARGEVFPGFLVRLFFRSF